MVIASAAEWAAVGSAVAAALAACASWASVIQTRRKWTQEHEPVLQVVGVVNDSSRQIRIEVHNVGGGFARDVAVVIVEGESYFISYVFPNGVIYPGRGVGIETPLLAQRAQGSPIVGAVMGFDAYGTLHAWSAGGSVYRRWSREELRRQPIANLSVFHAVVPNVKIDDLRATTATSNTEWHEIR